MSANPTSAPARNPQNKPSTTSLQPSQPRTSPSTNASFTSPKPMLRGEMTCNAPSAAMATTPPRRARPSAPQASSPAAARERSARVRAANGYTMLFGKRKCSKSITASAVSPAASARNANSTHESWYRSANPVKSATVMPASAAARPGLRSRRVQPFSDSRCGTRSTTTSRPSPTTRPATEQAATTAAVTRRPTLRPALFRAGRRRGPHDVERRRHARPQRERQRALVDEHAEPAGGAQPARPGFEQQRCVGRVHRVEDELAGLELGGVEGRRLAVHPERSGVDDHVEAIHDDLVETDGDAVGCERCCVAARVAAAGGDGHVRADAPERVRDGPRRAPGPEHPDALLRDRDAVVVERT